MGASHSWTIETTQPHRVYVQHATHTGRVKVTVDGSQIFKQTDGHALWDQGFDHEFQIDGANCRLCIHFPGGTPRYELWVNGKLQDS